MNYVSITIANFAEAVKQVEWRKTCNGDPDLYYFHTAQAYHRLLMQFGLTQIEIQENAEKLLGNDSINYFQNLKIMIKITKTILEVNELEFYNEIKRICIELENITPNQIGATFAVFKRELGLKMTELQFFILCKECEIKVHPRKYISFGQFKQN